MGPGTRTLPFGLLAFALVLTLVLAPAAEAKRIVGNRKANKLVGTGLRDDIYGRAGNDVLIGLGGADYLYGDGGDDVLLGEAGNDRLRGGGRDDTLDGGRGSDRIRAGWGTDMVDAGPGNDIVSAGENDAAVDTIDCGAGLDRAYVNRRDRVFNCEAIIRRRGTWPPGIDRNGTPGDDILSDYTWFEQDLIVGFGGKDYLNGHANADMLWGNEGEDTLDGDLSPDLLFGGAGNDWLMGHFGNDRLWGGWGLDRLDGREGDDEVISIEADGAADVIDCGDGNDRAIVRPNDQVVNCERVIRIAR
jgi:Ca2+-binding RTX toxin-like protein